MRIYMYSQTSSAYVVNALAVKQRETEQLNVHQTQDSVEDQFLRKSSVS